MECAKRRQTMPLSLVPGPATSVAPNTSSQLQQQAMGLSNQYGGIQSQQQMPSTSQSGLANSSLSQVSQTPASLSFQQQQSQLSQQHPQSLLSQQPQSSLSQFDQYNQSQQYNDPTGMMSQSGQFQQDLNSSSMMQQQQQVSQGQSGPFGPNQPQALGSVYGPDPSTGQLIGPGGQSQFSNIPQQQPSQQPQLDMSSSMDQSDPFAALSFPPPASSALQQQQQQQSSLYSNQGSMSQANTNPMNNPGMQASGMMASQQSAQGQTTSLQSTGVQRNALAGQLQQGQSGLYGGPQGQLMQSGKWCSETIRLLLAMLMPICSIRWTGVCVLGSSVAVQSVVGLITIIYCCLITAWTLVVCGAVLP